MNFHDSRDAMISDRTNIEDIKERFNLSSVIGKSVRLVGRNGKYKSCCPFHDDRTPSLSIRDDIGLFYCFGCGAKGDVIEYVKLREGVDFNQACRLLEEGYVATGLVRPSDAETDTQRTSAARDIWNAAGPITGTPASDYLTRRGLPLEFTNQQADLRFARLSFDRSATKHPALVAAARNVDGEIVAIQRIFLTEEGEKLAPDCKRSLGPCKGAAIRLTGFNITNQSFDHIHVCEGLEDGLTLARMGEAEVWVAMGATNLASVNLPAQCTKVTIATDNDEAGSKASDLATSAFLKQNRSVNTWAPPPQFKDWNDYLMHWEFEHNNVFGNDLPWLALEEDDFYDEDGNWIGFDSIEKVRDFRESGQ